MSISTSKIKTIFRNIFSFAILISKWGVSLIRHQRSKIFVRRLLKNKNEIFIELGGGDKKGQGKWLTIDVTGSCDIFWDLRKGIPFPDGCVIKIYSSHFFEHLNFSEIQKMLAECKRVLVDGGTFSICVPNAKLFIEAYLKSDSSDYEQIIRYKPAFNNSTSIDYVNYIAYMDGHHQYMFDEENLLFTLNSFGFRNVHLREFDSILDRMERDRVSIYAEAEK